MATEDRLHVVLGAGGAIGTPLAEELLTHGARVRTVSRSGRGAEGGERVRADLTDADATYRAIEGGSMVYLLAGLPYDRRVWGTRWPVIMKNVVGACESKQARLVFFDNVYLYGRVEGPMTEETPARPSSVKGTIRAGIAAFLQGEMAAGRITALIARAADFYGPYSEATSIPAMLVLQRLAAGKRAQVLVDAGARHSYSYTLDCAKALRLLAAEDDVFGQVWHMPTARPAPTGREFVEMAARAIGASPRMSVIPRWIIRGAGIFSPLMRELAEMLYQNGHDYVFDSTRFERRFGFAPVGYEDGIAASVRWMRRQRRT
jgi:nucleoside-diphosphate-sugar epimerase